MAPKTKPAAVLLGTLLYKWPAKWCGKTGPLNSTTTGWKPVGSDGNRELRTEVLRSRFCNLKVIAAVARLGAVLLADVFRNHLVGHVSA